MKKHPTAYLGGNQFVILHPSEMELTIKTVINHNVDKPNLGIKTLSLDNWMKSDPLMHNFAMLNGENGTPTPMTGNDWAASILGSKLLDEVPIEIVKLFEVARGSMLYGYFFYPLFTLASEQLYRVAETAIKAKCDQINAPKSKKTFDGKLKYLRDENVLMESEYNHWNIIRKLRNESSHPEQQTILTPGNVLDLLNQIANEVNALFCNSVE